MNTLNIVELYLVYGYLDDNYPKELVNICKDICLKIDEIKLSQYNLKDKNDMNCLTDNIIKYIPYPRIAIIEPYNEYLYNLLTNFGIYVYGCHCLLSCMLKNSTLPVIIHSESTIGQPIYTDIMDEYVITLTGIDPYLKSVLVKYITLLGAKYTLKLTDTTTHIVSGNGLTEESILARKNNIPIVTDGWITQNMASVISSLCSTSNSCKLLCPSSSYTCPLLYNIKICCLNFCAYKHIDIRNKILANGGLCFTNENMDCLHNVNVDMFIYLIPCNCGMCDKYESDNDEIHSTKWLNLIRHCNSSKKSTPLVKSSWLFTSIRSNMIAPFNEHIYQEDYLNGMPNLSINNYFHCSDKLIVIMDKDYDYDMDMIIEFFNKNDSVQFLYKNHIINTINCEHYYYYYQILSYTQFLVMLSSVTISKSILSQYVSIRWIYECYNHQKILPTPWFTLQIPLPFFYNSTTTRSQSLTNLLLNKRIYIANDFKLSYLFYCIDQLTELIIFMGAQITNDINMANIIFDNNNEHSKSLFWLESIIYYQQIIDEDINYGQSSFYNGYIDSLLSKKLFDGKIFEISDNIPSSVARHLIILIIEYGGILNWTTCLNETYQSSFDNDYILIKSYPSLFWLFGCISAGKILENSGNIANNYVDPHVLLKSLLTVPSIDTIRNTTNDIRFELTDAIVYLFSDIRHEDISNLIKVVHSYGGKITDILTSATHIIANDITNFPRHEISATTRILLCSLVLQHEENCNFTLNKESPKKTILSSVKLLPINQNTIIDTKLEESIQKSKEAHNRFTNLEKDIQNLMKKTAKTAHNPSFNDRVTNENILDSNFNSILIEMEQSYHIDAQQKFPIDLSPKTSNEQDVINTYDDMSDDSLNRFILFKKSLLNSKFNPSPNKITMGKYSNDKIYRFMLSSIVDEHKNKLGAIIKSLNGVYLNTNSFDPTCTHLVIGNQIIKNEKLLACLASGKIILHYSYLEQSKKVGYFVDDVQFLYSQNCNWIDPIYADVFAHWYNVVGDNNLNDGSDNTAFIHWHILLHLESPAKQEGFERLVVMAGGAKLYSVGDCLSSLQTNSSSIPLTHIFIENEAQNNFSTDFLQFASKHNDKIFRVQFLADYLLRYDNFNPELYSIKLNFPNPLNASEVIGRRRSIRKRRNLNNY